MTSPKNQLVSNCKLSQLRLDWRPELPIEKILVCGKWRGPSGGFAELGGKPFKEQTNSSEPQKPVFDPVAKIGRSGGGDKATDLVAVELFAVAPDMSKRRESNTIESIGASSKKTDSEGLELEDSNSEKTGSEIPGFSQGWQEPPNPPATNTPDPASKRNAHKSR